MDKNELPTFAALSLLIQSDNKFSILQRFWTEIFVKENIKIHYFKIYRFED